MNPKTQTKKQQPSKFKELWSPAFCVLASGWDVKYEFPIMSFKNNHHIENFENKYVKHEGQDQILACFSFKSYEQFNVKIFEK